MGIFEDHGMCGECWNDFHECECEANNKNCLECSRYKHLCLCHEYPVLNSMLARGMKLRILRDFYILKKDDIVEINFVIPDYGKIIVYKEGTSGACLYLSDACVDWEIVK